MGNPNARPKRYSGEDRPGSLSLNTSTKQSATFPKADFEPVFKSYKAGKPITENAVRLEFSPVASVPPKLAPLAFAKLLPLFIAPPALNAQGKSPTGHIFDSEPFKSYESVQIIYNANSTQVHLDHTLPLKLDLQPNSKPFKLCATTPAFLPLNQHLRTSFTLGAGGEGDEMMPSAFPGPIYHWLPDDEIRDRIQQIMPMGPIVQSQQMDEQYNRFDTPPGHSSRSSFPIYPEPRPVTPPRFYYKRANKSRKDFIITDKGAIRNAVKVVERFLPNGTSYHDYWPVFDESDYDFIAEFNAMSVDEKIELLNDKYVEVVVMLKTNDEEEKIDFFIKKKNKSKKKNNSKYKEGGSSMAAGDIHGSGKENQAQGAAEGGGHLDPKSTEKMNAQSRAKEDQAVGAKDDAAEVEDINNFGTANPKVTTVIDTINALGPDFAKHTTSLWVTLDFTGITPLTGSVPAIPTGPRAVTRVNPKQPLKFGANFAFVTQLVHVLQVFTELKDMRVNLRVRETPTGFPITLQQLALVLPFYDLGFIDWSISYQDEVFTATVPIRDNEYPMRWLDQQRNKIIRGRKRKALLRERDLNGEVSPAIFPKESRAQGMFSLSEFVKKSRK